MNLKQLSSLIPSIRTSQILIGVSIGLVLSGQARFGKAFTCGDLGDMFRGSVNRLAEMNGDRLSQEDIRKNRQINQEAVERTEGEILAYETAFRNARYLAYPQSVEAVKSRFGYEIDWENSRTLQYRYGTRKVVFWVKGGRVQSFEVR